MELRLGSRFAGFPAAWWLALLALAANDHVLKYSAFVPHLITGKLSDFAGLIVAPLLLCALFRTSSRLGRGIAFGLVALVFSAVKLSPVLCQAAGALLSAVGLRSRIWCDPTDLIALSIVPWAFRLRIDPLPMQTSTTRASQRFALALAGLACVATAKERMPFVDVRAPFIVNWTYAPIDVAVTIRQVSCAAPEVVDPTFKTVNKRIVVKPAHLVQLGAEIIDAAAAAQDGGGGDTCGRADVKVGNENVRLFWPGNDALAMRVALADDWYTSLNQDPYTNIKFNRRNAEVFDCAITLSGASSAPTLVIGTRLDVVQP